MDIRIRLAGLLVGFAVVAACSQPGNPVTIQEEAAVAERNTVSLDTYHQGDLAFYERFKLENAMTLPPPASLGIAAKQSTAVIVAEVVGVEATRTVTGETARDRFSKIGVVLRLVEVLKGALRPELAGRVVVEFMTPDGDAETAAEVLKSSLPRGQAIWFLHWLGGAPPGAVAKAGAPGPSTLDKQLYGLISMQGVFAQGADRVVCAVAAEEHGPAPDMASDGTRFAKLSELAAYLRTVR